jgi:signal peptidase II
MKGYTKPLLVVLLVLLADQILKIWIKLNMSLGQEYHILGKWFIIHFTENNGMAFGYEFGGETGKLALSILRIFAVTGIGYGLVYLIKKKYHRGLILNVSLIFAGAIGNIIDSIFYGKVFSESTYFSKAQLFPAEGGYASLFHGKVVDMLYFPIIETHFPSWFPIWANQPFTFFQPVFNLADTAISIGVILIMIFQKHYFKEPTIEETHPQSEMVEE